MSTLVRKFIRTRTRTYILFCDKTRVAMFYFLIDTITVYMMSLS